MVNKSSKTKSKKSQQCDICNKPVLCHPSTWLVAVLAIAFIAVVCAGAYVVKSYSPKSQLDSARLAVFNDLASGYIAGQDVTDNGIDEVYQMTGYGISDEDGTFYITFDFVDPADVTISEDGSSAVVANVRHGIMYFWKDAERGTYSHAYSYHDDNYHPAGTYVRLSE